MRIQTFLRRSSTIGLASVVATSTILSMSFGVVSAATDTWTGGGSNDKFSTAANWSGNVVPTNGDTITINTTGKSDIITIDNDVTGLSLAGINVTGTGNSVEFTDKTVSLSGNLALAQGLFMTGGLTLTSNVSVSGAGSLYGDYGDDTGTIALGSHNLTLASGYGAITTGSSKIVASGSANVTLDPASTFSGDVQLSGSSSLDLSPGTNPANITVANGTGLSLCGFKGASLSSNITISGVGAYSAGALTSYGSCNSGGGISAFDANASATLSGSVTLTGNTTANSAGELKLTGALSGNYTLTMLGGSVGKLTIASSANTSKTPNGAQASQAVTTTYSDNKPAQAVNADTNNVAVVDGTYGAANIYGGTLKGTGSLDTVAIASGILAPGHSPGTLTVRNTLSLDSSSTYQAEIQNTKAYDQVKVGASYTGTDPAVTLGSAKLDLIAYKGYSVKAGDVFTIIDNQSSTAISGTFAGLAEGDTTSFGNGGMVRVSYKGGDGNDVTLTVVTAPTTPDTGLAINSTTMVGAAAVFATALGLLVVARRTAARDLRK